MIDIVLYHIHARINPKVYPRLTKRIDTILHCLGWIKVGAAIPTYLSNDNSDGKSTGLPSRFNSNTKFNHQF